MWSSRLFWKVFLVYAGLNLTLAVGFLIVATSWQRTEINDQVEQRLHDTAVVLGSHVREFLEVALDEQAERSRRIQAQDQLQSLVKRLSAQTRTRLTVVDPTGEVLADSERDPKHMLNHSNRPEVIAARQTGTGTAMRRSPTLGIDMFYFALPVKGKSDAIAVVRVAVQLETINRRLAAIRRFLWSFALGLGLVAAALTYAMVGRIVHPLAQLTQRAQAIAAGKDEDPVPVRSRDEVGLLAEAFNKMQRQLAKRLRQLRENNEQLATILASMDEGIIAVDGDEKILLANEASRKLLDFVTDDEVGRALLEAARSRPLHDVVRQCLREGESVQTQFESAGPARRMLTVRGTCLPGVPCPGVVVVLHDITELRRLENLRHEFVANVSHELKTPLTAIKAYAETLRLGAVNDTQHNLGFVARIEEQADRLHHLILDLLQIARIETGQEVFEITEVAIGHVVEACVAQHLEAAQRKQITLRVEPPGEALTVRADKDGLRTILDNLVDNAIKYTTEGGKVTVRWRAAGSLAALEVQDTGIGIAEQDQARVFERFYRADKARSRELGGTGLGLSIVKHLCQAFGGSVALRSQLGQGSTFEVRLPLH